MKTIAISAVLDAAGPLAGRTSGFPAEEREMMRTPLALALETIWTAVEWPGLTVLEEFTLPLVVADTTARDDIEADDRMAGMIVVCTDTDISYELGAGLTNSDWTVATGPGSATGEVDRRVDTSADFGVAGGEIGKVWAAWDEDPRGDEALRTVWEETDVTLFFPDTAVESVWVEYVPPVPDLAPGAGTQAQFEAETVPRFMLGYLSLTAAAALHAADGHYDQEARRLAMAQRELERQIADAHIPARRARMQIETR